VGVKGRHGGLSLPKAVTSTVLLGVLLALSGHVIRISIRSAEAVPDRIATRIDASPVLPRIDPVAIAPPIEDVPVVPWIDAFPVVPLGHAVPVVRQTSAASIVPRSDASPVLPQTDPAAIAPPIDDAPIMPWIDAYPAAPLSRAAPIVRQIRASPIAPRSKAARITPQRNTMPVIPRIDVKPIVDQMRDELATAMAVTWADGSSIAFTVPDRDNDGLAESLDYRLVSGRLIRTCNGTSSALMKNVDDLRFEYQLCISEEQVTETVTDQSAEVVLAHHDGYPAHDYYYATLDMTPDQQWAHRFDIADLPEGAVSFTITYVMIRAAKSSESSAGPLILSMERPVSPTQGRPDGHVLDESTIDIGAMMTIPGWHRVTFGNLKDIPVQDNAFCLRVYGGTDLGCSVWASYLDDPASPDDGQQAYYTLDGGASWNPGNVDHDGDLCFYAYGTFTTAHTVEETVRVQRLTGVQITLTPRGSDLAVKRFARLAHEPTCDAGLADVELDTASDQPIAIEVSTDPLLMPPLATDPPEIKRQ
jgi:hypothetical protein